MTDKNNNWELRVRQIFGNVKDEDKPRKVINLIENLLSSDRERIIKEFIEGERCLRCGEYKVTDRPDLTDWCYKCLKNE